MRLTKLRLNGFKSFVDPTELIIADGLTGVVGPNGCGKSNILEALRWVMGENRPSAMRGDGMDDVIFAGAASRPARNFAEVSLHIDNTERRAPAGFNSSDLLEINRRITRDAGSAFKVNGKDVRARDVQMLFADASTGAHSPALVRQGEISELILLIQSLARSGITILIIEHHVDLIMALSEHVTVLDYGQVIANGSAIQVQRDPKVIEAYFGSSEALEDILKPHAKRRRRKMPARGKA